MYLSRMQLNPQRRGARKLLAHPRAMHAAVESCFPPPEPGAEGRNLWRVDRVSEHNTALYIVSALPPSFDHIQEQAGWSQQQTWATRSYDKVLEELAPGQTYSFRLQANPVVSKAQAGKRSQRVPLASAAAKQQWLIDRAEKIGVTFPCGAGHEEEPMVRMTRTQVFTVSKPNTKITLSRVQLDGVLEVVDPELLRSALVGGIGSGKACGCGLMTLAPLISQHDG